MSHGPGPGINRMPDMLALVMQWREKAEAPARIQTQRVINGKTEIDMPLYPYPAKTGYTEKTEINRLDGPRRGVDRIAERFRPAAAESCRR